MQTVDTGCIVYVALFVLFGWRLFCPWRCCGKWLQFANYCALLYFVLLCSLMIDCVTFATSALSAGGRDAFAHMAPWVKPCVLFGVVSMWITFALCAAQTVSHIEAIRAGEAVQRHDRVVQILALPVVYGAMAMAAASRVLVVASEEGLPALRIQDVDVETDEFISHAYKTAAMEGAKDVSAAVHLALARSETSYLVADLYEAWVLYQFLSLTLDVLWTALQRRAQSQDAEERLGAQALVKVHGATENLSWLGPYCFLLICIGQCGWSLYTLNVTADKSTWGDWLGVMSQFEAAGFLASGAAIFDVAVVERHFHDFFAGYSPMLKFVTVKILVSFSFFQRGIFGALKTLTGTLPDTTKKVLNASPFLGSIVKMGVVEFELFFAAIIMLECTFVAMLHWCAWNAAEDWYGESEDPADKERIPLVKPKGGAASAKAVEMP
eukprot:TRINITY_DN113795_c0_g1_i1.p1 TRINITY_DN113795_c0_g1~~TRINITY_DN113795_c0_g1_i1.p1  ORF type:complete len:438 (-),score=92.61 TRINITY_DN113795_c0_g1_i1:54-1367(-)